MIGQAVAHRALASLHRRGENRSFPGLVAVLSFTTKITQSVPFEWVVVTGALLNRRRWLALALSAATASSAAALGLYFAVHHFGWGLLAERYPDLPASQAWVQVNAWMSRYGMLALFALMALPLPAPKLPAFAFPGIYRLPIAEIGLAI